MASDDHIKFRCTKAFKRLVKATAKQRRRSMANFIIDALLNHMASEEKRLHLPNNSPASAERPLPKQPESELPIVPFSDKKTQRGPRKKN